MDDGEGQRGVAAWQAERAGIAKRNLETQKRGQAERRSRERAVEARERAVAVREARELAALNAEIEKRGGGG
jgi:hypothetical protein